jgi:uncharacterized protein
MFGGILSSCLSNSIPSKAILIYATRGIPDPEGAAILIESLGKITDNTSLMIDTTASEAGEKQHRHTWHLMEYFSIH